MKILAILAGSLLLLFGLISMVTPIPGGTLAIAAGAGLIICSSDTAAKKIKELRIKHTRLNKMVSWVEDKIGEKLSRPLRLTRPDEDALTEHSLPSKQEHS